MACIGVSNVKREDVYKRQAKRYDYDHLWYLLPDDLSDAECSVRELYHAVRRASECALRIDGKFPLRDVYKRQVQFVLSGRRQCDIAFFTPRLSSFYIFATIFLCVFADTTTVQVLQFHCLLYTSRCV